jgi:hypothetical protein
MQFDYTFYSQVRKERTEDSSISDSIDSSLVKEFRLCFLKLIQPLTNIEFGISKNKLDWKEKLDEFCNNYDIEKCVSLTKKEYCSTVISKLPNSCLFFITAFRLLLLDDRASGFIQTWLQAFINRNSAEELGLESSYDSFAIKESSRDLVMPILSNLIKNTVTSELKRSRLLDIIDHNKNPIKTIWTKNDIFYFWLYYDLSNPSLKEL